MPAGVDFLSRSALNVGGIQSPRIQRADDYLSKLGKDHGVIRKEISGFSQVLLDVCLQKRNVHIQIQMLMGKLEG